MSCEPPAPPRYYGHFVYRLSIDIAMNYEIAPNRGNGTGIAATKQELILSGRNGQMLLSYKIGG